MDIYYIKNKITGQFILGEAANIKGATRHGIIEWGSDTPKDIRLATVEEVNRYYASRGKDEVRKFI